MSELTMSELTSFLINISILIMLACNAINIFVLRSRIEELEQRIDKQTEKEGE